jgi:transposase-like protein
MARKKIDPEVKRAVLEALQNPDVNKVELAKQYSLSLPTLYNWRKVANVTVAPVETAQA